MNSQLFFLLNFLFGAIFVVWFLASRKDTGHKPTRLRLRAGNRAFAATPVATSRPDTNTAAMSAKAYTFKDEFKPRTSSRSLNVLFMYNGHDWDAYEVLGLPAGTGLPLVTERYQDLVQKSQKGQLEFYEAAYSAILKK